jgi:hypothetical protein
MVGAKIITSTKGPGVEKIKADMKQILSMHVLVGIPEDKISRKETAKINNAELLYLHTHGSELMKIPPRPVIEPAIEARENKEHISEQLSIAAKMVLNGKPAIAKRQLKTVGMLGQNIARAWFTDPRNNWPPNSPITIAKKGSERPLIDTGQLRQAIIYVVREDRR